MNVPDDCRFVSDLDYYESNYVGPRSPECAVCEFKIPAAKQDSTVQCAHHGCTRWICGPCRDKMLVGEDHYCDRHVESALRTLLDDAEKDRDAYRAALIRAVALGDIGPAIEGLAATSSKVTLAQELAASIAVVTFKRTA